MAGIAKGRIERAARIYNSSTAAARAIGISPSAFSRLCRKHGVETPPERRHRRYREARARRE